MSFDDVFNSFFEGGGQDDEFDWQSEWVGMPEFKQENADAYAKIIVRFENEEDLQDFANRIGQKLTSKTKSIWHPYKSHWLRDNKIWVHED